MSEHETTERQRRTEVARAAAQKTFARRRAERAIAELRAQGYIVVPPEPEWSAIAFDSDGAHRKEGRPTEYRCPGCGRGSWYVRGADRFYHRDGTDNTACYRSMHLGTNPYPFPKVTA